MSETDVRLACTGNLGTFTAFSPVNIQGFDDFAEFMDVGQAHVCASSQTQSILCWGDNLFGQLGDGSDIASGSAVIPAGINQPIRDIGLGEHHSCVVLESGEVMCWGKNSNGQIGNGTLEDTWVPTFVAAPDQDGSD